MTKDTVLNAMNSLKPKSGQQPGSRKSIPSCKNWTISMNETLKTAIAAVALITGFAGSSHAQYSGFYAPPSLNEQSQMWTHAAQERRVAAQNVLNSQPADSCTHQVQRQLNSGSDLDGQGVEQQLAQCHEAIAQQQQAQAEARAKAKAAQQAQAEATRQAQAEAAAARRQEMAENSPNNHCRDPAIARQLIADFNSLSTWLQAVDIEHLTTNVGTVADVSCHGVFVLTNGGRLEGNLNYSKNIAGDPIVRWVDGGAASLPELPAPASVAVVEPAPVQPADSANVQSAPQGDAIFQKGLSDRASWETWFNRLQGDQKTGAFYWAGQRSLSHPGSCQQMSAAFYDGCTAAKVRLAASDALRKSEPSYKRGWNSYTAQ